MKITDGLSPQIQELIRRLKCRVYGSDEDRALSPWAAGAFFPVEDKIIVGRTSEFATLDMVALHEIVHWTGHPYRINRKTIGLGALNYENLTQKQIATEEATAQFGMFKLLKFTGGDLAYGKEALNRYLSILADPDMQQAEKDADEAVAWIVDKASLTHLPLESTPNIEPLPEVAPTPRQTSWSPPPRPNPLCRASGAPSLSQMRKPETP
jgi:hypothetical protein